MAQPGFHSILADRPGRLGRPGRPPGSAGREDRQEPDFFADLNLDQVLQAMTAGRAEYDLAPFFYAPVADAAAVGYRQEVFRDIERAEVAGAIRGFARRMRDMRADLAQAEKMHYTYQRERWFVDVVAAYCDAVGALAADLSRLDVASSGLLAFREYLSGYVSSERFTSLTAETERLAADLARVRYCVHIKGNRVRVSHYAEEPDYSADVTETFAKFKQGEVRDYRSRFRSWPEMNHIEAHILDLVARLNPDVFAALDDYCERHSGYLDDRVGAFDREIQLYAAYLELVEPLRSGGLRFCYPEVSPGAEDVGASAAFDLALAVRLRAENQPVVCNDFSLTGPERILVVSGPNQGGKTTFARMFGQLHYLAALGFPVPGAKARLFLPDQVFTHFEREEDLATLSGKLEDELVRIHRILARATGRSIVIMNESFTSTTLRDALLLGGEVMTRLIDMGAICVCVTFVDELSSMDAATVSMVSTVVPGDPASRTYKVVRRPADGLAYAAAIAEKHGLSYQALMRRLAS